MNVKRLANLNRLMRSAIWLKKHGDPVPELGAFLREHWPAAVIEALDDPEAGQ